MSGYRQIHTKIWTDAWFIDLPADHKLLYIYFFSNERASVCGLYELPLRVIAFETSFDIEKIRAILEDFRAADKVEYDTAHSVIWIKNMAKYQASTSPKLQTRIQSDLKSVPECTLKDKYYTVSIGYRNGSDTLISSQSIVNLNLDLNGDKYQKVFSNYTNNIGMLTPFLGDAIKDAVDEYTPDWVNEAMNEAVRSEARNWKYVEAILKRWKTDGFKSAKKGGNGKMPIQATKPPSTAIDASKYQVKHDR